MKISRIVLVLLLIVPLFLQAEKMVVAIKYLGIKAVHVDIEQDSTGMSVHAKATSIASIASKLNNYYYTSYEGNEYPVSYEKNINQKDYSEKRVIKYNRDLQIATRTSLLDSTLTKSYSIHKDALDFFSALLKLRYTNEDEGDLWLDANGLPWKAHFTFLEKEKIRTFEGKQNCLKYKIDFTNITGRETERSDMLTNNLVSEENSLYIWFTDNEQRLPVKTMFKMSPFSVVWKMESYEL